MKFLGQQVTPKDLALIREVVTTCDGLSRAELANTVCELMDWKRPLGSPKGGDCGEFLERLESKGLLRLPGKRQGRPVGSRTDVPITKRGEPGISLVGSARSVGRIELEQVRTEDERRWFRELIGRYHYLGHAVPMGAHLRYLVFASEPRKARWGRIHDGAGKRYLLGPLFLLLDDLDNAINCFRWFEAEFPDDCGEPGHHPCWALALRRCGDYEGAARKLQQTMLMNIYLIPYLLGQKVERMEMCHGSSDAEPGYLEEIPLEFFFLWDEGARQWAAQLYHSQPFMVVLSRYIEIHRQLLNMPPGPKRTRLVTEAFSLKE